MNPPSMKLLLPLALALALVSPAQAGETPSLRLLRCAAPENAGALLYAKENRKEIDPTLRNDGPTALSLRYTFKIADFDDRVRFQSEGRLDLPAGTERDLALPFAAEGWPLGPYEAEVAFLPAQDAATAPLLKRTIRLGLISSAALDKARPGEFLYGLDIANHFIFPTHTPLSFAYLRLMGVDLVRNPYDKGTPQTPEGLGKALAELAPEGLRSMLMCDPPRDTDPAKRADALRAKAAFLRAAARAYAGEGPGRFRYCEIGNEPDLPRFFPGTPEDYLASLYAMAGALRAGAAEGGAPGAALAMNGGLSFAGVEGDRRSRRILELLDPARIDALAYHGHGPGIGAERSAYERVRAAAKQYGKDGLPYVETESGFSAHNHDGLLRQARTAVEKMTYAQSKDLPLLIFFRLFMEGDGVEGGYGMTENFSEPRPSVLAYRNLVEQLRHARFAKALDFDGKAGTEGIDAYVFEERDAAGRPTGRKTVVAFCETARRYELRVRLDAKDAAPAGHPLFHDLFGNARPVEAPSNVAVVPVGTDPVYLSWSSSGAAALVEAVPPPISAPGVAVLLPGAPNPIAFTASAPDDRPADAEIVAEVRSPLPLTAAPTVRKIALRPGQPAPGTVDVRVPREAVPPALPRWWKVFPDVDFTRLGEGVLAAIPDRIALEGKTFAGTFAAAPKDRLDFGKAAGGFVSKRPGIAYAYIDAPEATNLECGAAGDWWMAWYLNGKKVYDTLEKGNEAHGPVSDHPFVLPLRKGRNVVAVGVLSGSAGWAVEYGGPQALQQARNDADRLVLTLRTPGGVPARSEIPLLLDAPVPPLGTVGDPEDAASWMPLEPFAQLGEEAVTNFWVKEPDSSKWYHGPGDLSALVWLRDDGKELHLFAAVADDRQADAPSRERLAEGDSLRLVLADDGGKPLLDTTAGLVGGLPARIGGTPDLRVSIRRDGEGGRTLYHLVLPRTLVGTAPFRVSLCVADNDAGYLKQTLLLGDPSAPAKGRRVLLP